MLTASHIFIELNYSNLVSNLNGLMQCILYLIFIAPHCNIIVPLVKHCFITKGTLYGVSNLYAVQAVSMILSPTLQSQSTLCLFSLVLSLLIFFFTPRTYEFPIRPMFYWQNHITAKYQLTRTITFFSYWLLSELQTLLQPKCPSTGYFCQRRSVVC